MTVAPEQQQQLVPLVVRPVFGYAAVVEVPG